MVMNAFGNRLRRLRLDQGLSLGDVAKKTMFTPDYLAKIERGDRPPPDEQKTKALAKALGVDAAPLAVLGGFQKYQAALSGVWRTLNSLPKAQQDIVLEHLFGVRPDAGWAGWFLARQGSSPGINPLMMPMAALAGLAEDSVLQQVMEAVRDELAAGVKHGDFEIRLDGAIKRSGDRQVVVKAGKVHRFTVPKSEAEAVSEAST